MAIPNNAIHFMSQYLQCLKWIFILVTIGIVTFSLESPK
jgi:hypothetical protein